MRYEFSSYKKCELIPLVQSYNTNTRTLVCYEFTSIEPHQNIYRETFIDASPVDVIGFKGYYLITYITKIMNTNPNISMMNIWIIFVI